MVLLKIMQLLPKESELIKITFAHKHKDTCILNLRSIRGLLKKGLIDKEIVTWINREMSKHVVKKSFIFTLSAISYYWIYMDIQTHI